MFHKKEKKSAKKDKKDKENKKRGTPRQKQQHPDDILAATRLDENDADDDMLKQGLIEAEMRYALRWDELIRELDDIEKRAMDKKLAQQHDALEREQRAHDEVVAAQRALVEQRALDAERALQAQQTLAALAQAAQVVRKQHEADQINRDRLRKQRLMFAKQKQRGFDLDYNQGLWKDMQKLYTSMIWTTNEALVARAKLLGVAYNPAETKGLLHDIIGPEPSDNDPDLHIVGGDGNIFRGNVAIEKFQLEKSKELTDLYHLNQSNEAKKRARDRQAQKMAVAEANRMRQVPTAGAGFTDQNRRGSVDEHSHRFAEPWQLGSSGDGGGIWTDDEDD